MTPRIRTVFFYENAKLIDGPDHSEDEDRFVLLGLSSFLRVILVCHCYRDEGCEAPLADYLIDFTDIFYAERHKILTFSNSNSWSL